MKIGTILPLFSGDADRVLKAARETEDLGFDGAFVFDHFFPPGAPPDRPALEPFTVLAAMAETTERIALGTLVARASMRPVGMLAKTAAWLDAAAGGRLVLGVGTGDATDRAEHDTYGIPMLGRDERRAQLGETVQALKALFAGKAYPGGRLVPAMAGPLAPAPSRGGGPPIWVGAQAEQVIRLAGRLADGWNGWGLNPAAFQAKARILAEEAQAAGRRAEATWAGIVLVGTDAGETEELLERRRARGMDNEIWAGTAPELVSFLRDLEAAGAAWAIMVPAGPADRRSLIGTEVLPALRR